MSRTTPTLDAAPLDLAGVACLVAGTLVGDGSLPVRGVVGPGAAAGPDQLALVLNQAALAALAQSSARIALVVGDLAPAGLDAYVTVDRPRYALARLLPRFEVPPRRPQGIHPSAVVEASAQIAPGAAVGPLCYVGENVQIGAGSCLLAQVTVGADSQIGADCLLHPGVRIGEGVRIGRGVRIHANACIGGDGFSFATSLDTGLESGRRGPAPADGPWEPLRIPSLGGVIIEDEVEIGACATIDRGTLGDTRVGRATKIDNLVQVGHNSRIGDCCLIAAQTGISGSCEIGDRVAMGGQVGIADHLRIGTGAVLAAGAGVSEHVPPKAVYIDMPAVPYERFRERYLAVGRLKRLFREVNRLKQQVPSSGSHCGDPDDS